MPNAATAVAAASSNLRTFGTKSGTAPTSAMKIAHDLMRSKGISGIYKGLGATLARYTHERYIDVPDNWMLKKESQFDLKSVICRAKFSCFDSKLIGFLFLRRDVPFSCIYFPLFAYLRLEVCYQPYTLIT